MTNDQALAILLTGQEIGLAPAAAMRGVQIVNGKAFPTADTLVAVVRASGLCASWQVIETTPERCVIRTQRVGASHTDECVWTMAEAKRANLGGKPGPWQQYPAQMLRARASSELARRVYQDVTLGLYSVEEEVEHELPSAAPAPFDTGLALLEAARQSIDEIGEELNFAQAIAVYADHITATITTSDRRALQSLVAEACTKPLARDAFIEATATESDRLLTRLTACQTRADLLHVAGLIRAAAPAPVDRAALIRAYTTAAARIDAAPRLVVSAEDWSTRLRLAQSPEALRAEWVACSEGFERQGAAVLADRYADLTAALQTQGLDGDEVDAFIEAHS
tara:strand:+ start:655 stop:1668 length:1014 start_codon:yes stop_codon:yes gene_type:complete